MGRSPEFDRPIVFFENLLKYVEACVIIKKVLQTNINTSTNQEKSIKMKKFFGEFKKFITRGNGSCIKPRATY